MHAVVCQSLPLLLFISQQYYFHHLIQSSILVSFYSYRSSILLSRSQFHVIYDCGGDDWSIASWYSAVIAALSYWSVSGLSCSTLLVDIFILFACFTLLLLRLSTLHIGVARQKESINSASTPVPLDPFACHVGNVTPENSEWFTQSLEASLLSSFFKPNVVVKLLRGHRYHEHQIRLVYKNRNFERPFTIVSWY